MFSTFQCGGESAAEGQGGPSRRSSGGTLLDNAEFLHQHLRDDNSGSIHPQSESQNSDFASDSEKSSVGQQTTFNAMSHIRRSYQVRKLPEKSIDIIMASWRKSTQKQYSTYINRWVSFCSERKIDTVQAPIQYIIEFLTELFDSGLGYETLNTARSSLSSLCAKQDGYMVGCHPLVIRFLSGVYNLRPTKPKYIETWDISKCLRYLKTLAPVESLNLKMLSCKLVMLIALTQASRCQSIAFLSIENMKHDEESLVLYYSGLLKQCRKGRVSPTAKFLKYSPDSDICVYTTLCEYIKRTQKLRGEENRLIISYIKPYRHVTTTTVSRWIKTVMGNSGIDITKFKSHSTRSASTSKVKQSGVPISEIMKVAGWASDKTFSRFYDKPVENNESLFQTAALQ